MSGVKTDAKCTDVRQAFLAGVPLKGPGVDSAIHAHLQDCPGCQGLYVERPGPLEVEEAFPSELGDLEALREIVHQQQEEEERSAFARLRAVPQAMRWVIALGSALLAVLFGLLSTRADMGVYPTFRMALALVPQSVLTLLLCAILLRPIYKPAWPRHVTAWLLAGLIVPLVISVLPQAHSPHPESAMGVDEDLLSRIAGCAAWGTIAAAPFVALLLMVARQGLTFRSLHLMVAVTGGVVANIALQLHCPLTSPVHLMPGHGLVGLILMGIVIGVVRSKR